MVDSALGPPAAGGLRLLRASRKVAGTQTADHGDSFLRNLLERLHPSAQRRMSEKLSDIDQLIDVLIKYSLPQSVLTECWNCVRDLLHERNYEARKGAFRVMWCIINEHFDHMGLLRKAFFDIISTHPGDFTCRIKALSGLVDNGRKIEPFTEELAALVLDWLEDCNDYESLYDFITEIVRRGFYCFNENFGTALVDAMCRNSDAAIDDKSISKAVRALEFFDVVVRYGTISPRIVGRLLKTLCSMVNWESSCWKVMRNVLTGECGVQSFLCLLRLLDEPERHSSLVCRGAVFFVGMSAWGSQRISSLPCMWTTILPSLLHVIECNHALVVYEAMLAIHRLVKKFGEDLRAEWDYVLDILLQVRPWLSLSTGQATSSLPTPSVQILSVTGGATGSSTTLAGGQQSRQSQRDLAYGEGGSSSSNLKQDPEQTLRRSMSQSRLPGNPLNNVTSAGSGVYIEGTGGESEALQASEIPVSIEAITVRDGRIRQEILETISLVEELYVTGKFSGDVGHFFSLLEAYVPYLPERSLQLLLQYQALDANPSRNYDWLRHVQLITETFFLQRSMPTSIRLSALQVLTNTLKHCRRVYENEMIEQVLIPCLAEIYNDEQRVVRQKGLELVIEVSKERKGAQFESLLEILVSAVYHAIHEDAQEVAIHGIVSLFESTFDSLPANRALRIYDLLTKFLYDHSNVTVRKVAMCCLSCVTMASMAYHLTYRRPNAQPRISRFLYCTSRLGHSTGGVVGVFRAVNAIHYRLEEEQDPQLFLMLVDGLKQMLSNKRILEDVSIDKMCQQMCSMICSKAFGSAAMALEIAAVQSVLQQAINSPPSARQKKISAVAVQGKLQSIAGPFILSDMPITGGAFAPGLIGLTTVKKGSSKRGQDAAEVARLTEQAALNEARIQSKYHRMAFELLLLICGYAVELSASVQDDLVRCYLYGLSLKSSSPSSSSDGSRDRDHSPNYNFQRKFEGETDEGASGAKRGYNTYYEGATSTSSTGGLDASAVSGADSQALNFDSSVNMGTPFSSGDGERTDASKPPAYSRYYPSPSPRGGSGSHPAGIGSSSNASPPNMSPTSALQTVSEDNISLTVCVLRGLSVCAMSIPCAILQHLTHILKPLESLATASDNSRNKSFLASAIIELLTCILVSQRIALTSDDYLRILAILLSLVDNNMETSLVVMLAYKCIMTTFCRCPLIDRSHLAAFAYYRIAKYAREPYSCPHAEAALDLMAKLAYTHSDVTSTFESPLLPPESSFMAGGEVQCKTWIQKNTIITIRTGSCGYAEITLRRITGASRWTVRLENEVWNPAHHPLLKATSSALTSDWTRNKDPLSEGEHSEKMGTVEVNKDQPTDDLHQSSHELLEEAAMRFDDELIELMSGEGESEAGDEPKAAKGSAQEFTEDLPLQFATSSAASEIANRVRKAMSPTSVSSAGRGLRSSSSTPRLHHSSAHSDTMDPAFVLLQLQGIAQSADPPLSVENGQALERALSVLDRTPGLETHKIGILYVKDNQTSEQSILGNMQGSALYLRFLTSLGELVKLKGLTKYTGGLDISSDSDGEYGLFWQDDCTQAMFHVATLMDPRADAHIIGGERLPSPPPPLVHVTAEPRSRISSSSSRSQATAHKAASRPSSPRPSDTSPPHSSHPQQPNQGQPYSETAPIVSQQQRQQRVILKKRHIGNDFVHIVFMESDQPYDFNTIHGQFNHVHIVIRPHDDGRRTSQVEIMSKPGLPPFGPLFGKQVIPNEFLAALVRQTAFNANHACRVFHEGAVESVSNAAERLLQIRRVRDKLTASPLAANSSALEFPPSSERSGLGSKTRASRLSLSQAPDFVEIYFSSS